MSFQISMHCTPDGESMREENKIIFTTAELYSPPKTYFHRVRLYRAIELKHLFNVGTTVQVKGSLLENNSELIVIITSEQVANSK